MSTPGQPEDPAHASRRIVRFELAPRTIFAIALVVAVVWLFVRLVPVLLVLVAALMMVGALNPLVAGLERRGFRRSSAIGIVFDFGVGLTALELFLTLPTLLVQVRALIQLEPDLRRAVVGFLEDSPLTRMLADELRTV
ncbi:MAG: AI-2E family transporter [Opitutus sp.]|nr:AI-2E family transporter [Opitutus sp.]